MVKLLVVETSSRGELSISPNMTQRFVSSWKAAHPKAVVVVRDLAKTDLQFISAPWIEAYFTPPEHQSGSMANELRLSDELVSELLDADHILIATPVYNYNVPAALKAWIDNIVRKGFTLGFDGKGMVKDKKATIHVASGGVYTQGSPVHDRDIATQ